VVKRAWRRQPFQPDSPIWHRPGDLTSERRYSPVSSCSQCKLAMLTFARELQKRSDRNDWRLLSVAAHPGDARTDLTKGRRGPAGIVRQSDRRPVRRAVDRNRGKQSAPTLSAATDPAVVPGGY
jgi:hypothetical protein